MERNGGVSFNHNVEVNKSAKYIAKSSAVIICAALSLPSRDARLDSSTMKFFIVAVYSLMAVASLAAVKSVPLQAPSKASPGVTTLFERVPASISGVVFDHKIDYTHPLKSVHHSSLACGGVAIGDVNGDQRADIFLSKGPGKNGLFLNKGDFRFVDATDASGLGVEGIWSAGCAFADVDNDGDLDLFVANYDSPNFLYINDGKGHFVESAAAAGVNLSEGSLMPAFCDYDHDGDLDMFLVTYRYYWLDGGGRPESITSKLIGNQVVVQPPYDKYYTLEPGDPNDLPSWKFKEIGRPDYFYRNNGDGTFTDVTEASGIYTENAMGNSATWVDYDNDGWMDIYVANDFMEADRLYKNLGNGQFREVLRSAIMQSPWYAMGAGIGDLNGDGQDDLMVTDMAATSHYYSKINMGDMSQFTPFLDSSEPRQFMRNAVYLGTGTPRLLEAGSLIGLGKSNWSWSVQIADFDCDGKQDVFVSNGMVRDFMNSDAPQVTIDMLDRETAFELFEKQPERREKNLAFKNEGDLTFAKVGDTWGLDHEGMSYGAARGDLDGDGDLDLVVCNLEEEVHLYRNQVQGANRIGFRLAGRNANRMGAAAQVKIRTASGAQTRRLIPQQGFTASNEPVVYFGLGEDAVLESAQVIWPGGGVQDLGVLQAGNLYHVTEEAAPPATKATEVPARRFKQEALLEFARHREVPYDDYADQPLLPNKLSHNGPGIAFADVDGDGREDFFKGGAAGSSGELHVQVEQAAYKWKSMFVLAKSKQSEDMAPLFFDADGDGDQDLYVVSGSVEQTAGSESYRDRIYLNDGAGKFSASPAEMLPDLRDSGSVVVAADYDRDGDLDLFVGSRVIPHKYPLPASSRLLQNNAGTFSDVSEMLAPELKEMGLVTSAVWSDVDNDGFVDLLVTSEWGPIKYFHNEAGTCLKEMTKQSGLSVRTGWWNGIAGRDIDNDGDIDYLVTNFGLNTKYKADDKHPATIYYGDFDGTGDPQVVEASYEDDRLLPRRGRSCSSGAMPFIAQKFGTYHDFALASLQDVYTPTKLDTALKLVANDLRTTVLLNDGKGIFTFKDLPRDVQISVGFGVVLTDFNGDGKTDACIAQNFFHPQRETPRMGGGTGALLLGAGDGTFRHAWINESGIDVPEDARSLAVSDLNHDNRPDLTFGINDGVVRTFVNAEQDHFPLAIRLAGKPGNPTAVGSRVTAEVNGLPPQTAEVVAGGGYLSQSSATLFFGAGDHLIKELQVTVRWPDGEQKTYFQPDGRNGQYLITQ
jgi:hypothetical protein